jgi:hypothetical protein
MCQYIVGESNAGWCSAYTEYDGVTTKVMRFYIATEANNTASPRTATINCTAISNVRNSSGNIGGILWGYQYTKKQIDENCTYTICEDVGTITVTQSPFGVCDCTTSEFNVAPYSIDKDAIIDYDDTSVSWSIIKSICGEATYDAEFVDENGNPTSYTWVTGYDFYTTTYRDIVRIDLQLQENDEPESPSRKLYIKVTMHLTDTTYGGSYDCPLTLSLTQQGTCTCDSMIVSSYTNYVAYSGDTSFAIMLTVAGKCNIVTIADISFSFDEPYTWISSPSLYIDNGYIWAEFNVSPNPDGSMRTAYYTVSVYGTDCSKTHLGIYQYGNPCANCSTLLSRLLATNYETTYFDYNQYTSTASTEITRMERVEECGVRHLTYSLIDIGDGTNWLTAITNSDGDVEVYPLSSNAVSSYQREAEIRITPLDVNGLPVIDDCYKDYRIVQNGTGTVVCNCSSFIGDENYLHITAGTPNSNGGYTVPMSAGETKEIGYIEVPYNLPDCLTYTTTNTQVTAVTMSVTETVNRRRFKIIATATLTASASAESYLIRVDNSASHINQCWTMTITFIFE